MRQPVQPFRKIGPALAKVWVALALTGLLPVAAQPAASSSGSSTPPTKVSKPAVSTSGPAWAELTPRQQAALKPLAPIWGTISEAHKRKWIAMSANYGAMHPEDQSRLHGRMSEWATLSPQQRAQARLNFAQTKSLPTDEKKAKWEAYQALSAEEKRKLASTATPRPAGAATAVKPVAPQKMATLPTPKRDVRHPAKIAADLPHTEPAALVQPAPGSSQ